MFRPGVGVNRLGFVGWGVATIARVHEAIALAGSSSAGLEVAFDRATLPWHAGHVHARGKITGAPSCSAAPFGAPTMASKRAW
jgi:hypothetical protein